MAGLLGAIFGLALVGTAVVLFVLAINYPEQRQKLGEYLLYVSLVGCILVPFAGLGLIGVAVMVSGIITNDAGGALFGAVLAGGVGVIIGGGAWIFSRMAQGK